MSDDRQELFDEFFNRIVEFEAVSDDTKLLSSIMDEAGTEGTPSGSQCPLSHVPHHKPGDTMSIYVQDGRPQLALANEVGDLLNIHLIKENGHPMIHIAINGKEMSIDPEVWVAASMIMDEELDKDD